MQKINALTLPMSKIVAWYTLDGTEDAKVGSDANASNIIWETADKGYVTKRALWGASSSFTYSSITYVNSYIIKDSLLVKNSSEVTSTAISGTSGSSYGSLIFVSSALTNSEEKSIQQHCDREMGPINSPKSVTSHSFPSYSTSKLNEGKILEISRPAVGGTYYDQTGSGNNGTGIVNVTDSPVGNYNGMTFANGGITLPTSTQVGRSFSIITSLTYNETGARQCIWDDYTAGFNRMLLWVEDDDTVQGYASATPAFIISDIELEDGKTYNIIYSVDEGIRRLFIDGILTAETLTTSYNTTGEGQGRYIGRRADISTDRLNSTLNIFKIKHSPTTAEEAMEMYLATFIPND